MTVRRILVVDDEDNLRTMLVAALKFEGYDVLQAAHGRDALEIVRTERPDLVVLDVMMPDLDGHAVLTRLRESGNRTPIVFLTARDTSADAVAGLALGADDYLSKPFALEELVARVEAVLRRAGAGVGTAAALKLADLEVDDLAHRVTRSGRTIDLSPTEYRLLVYLLRHAGRVLSRGQLLEGVWGYHADSDASVVETYIGYLRKKVDADEPKLIHTVRGIGYAMRVDA